MALRDKAPSEKDDLTFLVDDSFIHFQPILDSFNLDAAIYNCFNGMLLLIFVLLKTLTELKASAFGRIQTRIVGEGKHADCSTTTKAPMA